MSAAAAFACGVAITSARTPSTANVAYFHFLMDSTKSCVGLIIFYKKKSGNPFLFLERSRCLCGNRHREVATSSPNHRQISATGFRA
jgi:hypothetical protein